MRTTRSFSGSIKRASAAAAKGKTARRKEKRRPSRPLTPPAAAVPSSPSPPAAAVDTNTLLQTVLLQALTAAKTAPAPPAAEDQATTTAGVSPSSSIAADEVRRSIERLHYQIQSLFDKLDRMDIDKHLQANNQAIERIVKKAVGKLPVNDVDVEDLAKDHGALLARLEQLKAQNAALTDSYHKALEALGRHKDETAGLRNDLAIERAAAAARLEEQKERARLERVDAEVQHRRALEAAVAAAAAEGREAGHREGFRAGQIDSLAAAGSASADDLKQMLHTRDTENVSLQSQLAEAEGRRVQERRELHDQIASLQSLVARLEARKAAAVEDFTADIAAQTKRIRRAMNSLYAAAEEQFYAAAADNTADAIAAAYASTSTRTTAAGGGGPAAGDAAKDNDDDDGAAGATAESGVPLFIEVGDALALLLVAVRTETRAVVDAIKNDAAARAATAAAHAATSAATPSSDPVVRAFTIHNDNTRFADAPTPPPDDQAPGAPPSATDPADIDALRKDLVAFEQRHSPPVYDSNNNNNIINNNNNGDDDDDDLNSRMPADDSHATADVSAAPLPPPPPMAFESTPRATDTDSPPGPGPRLPTSADDAIGASDFDFSLLPTAHDGHDNANARATAAGDLPPMDDVPVVPFE